MKYINLIVLAVSLVFMFSNVYAETIADDILKNDILNAIKAEYGTPGKVPILVNCKNLGQHENGAFVELWSVELSDNSAERDFVISMKQDETGETDVAIIPK